MLHSNHFRAARALYFLARSVSLAPALTSLGHRVCALPGYGYGAPPTNDSYSSPPSGAAAAPPEIATAASATAGTTCSIFDTPTQPTSQAHS